MDKKNRLKAANQIHQAFRNYLDIEDQLVKVLEENVGNARTRGTYIFDKRFDQMLLDFTKALKGGPDPRKEFVDSMASAIAEAKDVLSPKLHSQPGRELVH
jgi:hypothetical protein